MDLNQVISSLTIRQILLSRSKKNLSEKTMSSTRSLGIAGSTASRNAPRAKSSIISLRMMTLNVRVTSVSLRQRSLRTHSPGQDHSLTKTHELLTSKPGPVTPKSVTESTILIEIFLISNGHLRLRQLVCVATAPIHQSSPT